MIMLRSQKRAYIKVFSIKITLETFTAVGIWEEIIKNPRADQN